MLRFCANAIASFVRNICACRFWCLGGGGSRNQSRGSLQGWICISRQAFLFGEPLVLSHCSPAENVCGFIEMACADGPAPVPGTKLPRWPWSWALSPPLSPSEGTRWQVPAWHVQEQSHPVWWAAQCAWGRWLTCHPRMFIFPEPKPPKAGKQQARPFLVLCFQQAVPKAEEAGGGRRPCSRWPVASRLPTTPRTCSPNAETVSVPNQTVHQGLQVRLLPRHPDSARRIWNLLRALKRRAPEMSTWKQKRCRMTPGRPVEKDRGLPGLLGITGRLLCGVLNSFKSSGSRLPGLLPRTGPGPWNKQLRSNRSTSWLP